MSEIILNLSEITIDAAAQEPNLNTKENVSSPKISIDKLVDDLSKEDYKSIFFLLMDYDVGLDNFISLTNQDLPELKAKLIKIWLKYFRNESIFVELFGTLKMNQKLKLLGTCFHVHESQRDQFKLIKEVWKVLYNLCEEMTDEDVKNLKQNVPEKSRNRIQSAEDWFCWALNENIFSRTDLSRLETIFKAYPDCLKIIRSFKDFELYDMKVPSSSSSSSCGIALIFNYDKFDKKSCLKDRKNSKKDVEALKQLWENFGFEVKDRHNLSCRETFKEIKDCASIDHSKFDAFVCCILSHGKTSNSVFASDGETMEISDLIWPIMNKCQTLINKPKLFFIQACRGTNLHQGPGKPTFCLTDETHTDASTSPPITSDTLISYSSIDGYVSFSDVQGSWFIQTFCRIMTQNGDTYTIDEVMIKVNEEILNNKANFGSTVPQYALQMPEYRCNLRKKLIFKKRIK